MTKIDQLLIYTFMLVAFLCAINYLMKVMERVAQ